MKQNPNYCRSATFAKHASAKTIAVCVATTTTNKEKQMDKQMSTRACQLYRESYALFRELAATDGDIENAFHGYLPDVQDFVDEIERKAAK